MSKPIPPKHLSASSQAIWLEIVRDYELEEPHITTTTLACEQLDIANKAGDALRDSDVVIRAGTGSLKVHPAVQVQRQATECALKLFRYLDITPPEEVEPI